METPTLFNTDCSAEELADRAIAALEGGDIDPVIAFIAVTRMEKAIAAYKQSRRVLDITLTELEKYGKETTLGDCTLSEVETGVKYDFTNCGDDTLDDLYAQRKALDERIKVREATLKALPHSGMADVETGSIIYPPARSSKTTIKAIFKRCIK